MNFSLWNIGMGPGSPDDMTTLQNFDIIINQDQRIDLWFSGKESTCNPGDAGSIPGSGRSPGVGNGNQLQYSCLENSMDRGAWWATAHGVAKSQTQLSDFTFTFFLSTFEQFTEEWKKKCKSVFSIPTSLIPTPLSLCHIAIKL